MPLGRRLRFSEAGTPLMDRCEGCGHFVPFGEQACDECTMTPDAKAPCECAAKGKRPEVRQCTLPGSALVFRAPMARVKRLVRTLSFQSEQGRFALGLLPQPPGTFVAPSFGGRPNVMTPSIRSQSSTVPRTLAEVMAERGALFAAARTVGLGRPDPDDDQPDDPDEDSA